MAPDEDENPIIDEYRMGEHLGSPLRFPRFEFDLFINFTLVGVDLCVYPI